VIFVVFTVMVGLPLYAQASFLSTLFSNAQADTVTYKDHVQNMALPDPNNELSPTNENAKTILAQNTQSLSEGVLDPVIGPLGTINDVDDEVSSDIISVYTVHKGDSLPKIAALFDVSVNTIRWANNLKKDYTPKEGDTLVILPVDGVSYVVRKGDTLRDKVIMLILSIIIWLF
jgi:nucleoid-associated protein YgaU